MEVWKDIKGYEGLYELSNLGRIKSLSRERITFRGGKYISKELYLKQKNGKYGYCSVNLNKNNSYKQLRVHQIVAMSFLNHNPCRHNIVVDHINKNKKDNRLCNLRLVTNRENCSNRTKKYTSKYVGVYWSKHAKKWTSQIVVNKKTIYLGRYNNEYEAHLVYQEALKKLL